jgi:hypothetical protein
MAVKYFDDQLDNEDVKIVMRKHPVVMRKGLILGSVGLLVGPMLTTILTTDFGMKLFRMAEPPTLNFFYLSILGSFILAALLFFPTWMSWYFSVYILTTQRFIQVKQQGFFDKSMVDIGLDTISMVNYEVKGIQETLLGFGTIRVQTYVGELILKDMHHPAALQKEITTVMRSLGFLKQTSSPVQE